MKICFLSSMHPADDKRVHHKEAVSLVKAGYDVIHICPDAKGDRMLDGVKVVTYTGKRSIAGRLTQLSTLYRLAVDAQADAYHCNEVDSWMVGVWLKISHGKTLVFDSHEIPSHDFAETRLPRPLRPLAIVMLRGLFQVMLRFTDRIVLAKRSAALDFPHAKVPMVLVQNFTDPDMAGDIETISAAKDDKPITVVHLGAINRMRGWPEMLDALCQTRNTDIRLSVIGKFGDGSEDEFLAAVKSMNLSHRVDFTPWLPYNEVYAALRRADIGIILFQPVMHSFTHALPHKLFDYMLAELPVIVPDFAIEVADIVNQSGCGVTVDVTDMAAVAGALDRLADDAALRRELGIAGRKAVFETYNWTAEEKKLVDMYAELSANGAATPHAPVKMAA